MPRVVFQNHILRLVVFIFFIVLVHSNSGPDQHYHAPAILCIAMLSCMLILNDLYNYIYPRQTFSQTIIRWFYGLYVICIISKVDSSLSFVQWAFSDIYETPSFPVENAEILACINFRLVLNCVLDEILYFAKLIVLILKYFCRHHGKIKPLLYLLYLTFNAFLFLYVINTFLQSISVNLQDGILRESNFINDSTTEYSYLSRRPYSNNSLNNSSIVDNDLDDILRNDRCVRREDFVRFLGEDIQIKCHFYILEPLSSRVDMYWMKNNERISVTSDRIQENFTRKVSSYTMWGSFTLNIRFLQEEDFGLYRCITETTYIYFKLIPLIPQKIFSQVQSISKRCACEFFVFRAADVKEVVEIPVGNVFYRRQFSYISLSDFDDISYEYKVNGKDVHETCINDISCSLFVRIYILLVYRTNSFKGKFTVIKQSFGITAELFIKTHMCVCGRMFGVHTLTMFIRYYNSTSNREEIVEITHEKNIIVQPVPLWGNSSIMSNTPLDALYLDSSEEIKQYITDLTCSTQDFVLLLMNMSSWILLILTISFLYKCFSRMMQLYSNWFIIPVKNKIFHGNFFPQLHLAKNSLAEIAMEHQVQYHVFVSHSMDNYEWTKRVILPFLEKDCGYKVCFPERDLSCLGTKLSLYSKATQESIKYLIVLSASYLDDPDCNRLQLSSCILPLMNSELGKGREVIILKLSQGIRIPEQLEYNRYVRIIDWTNEASDEEKIMRLKSCLQFCAFIE